MNIEIKKMQSDEEIKGKAYVHWKSWQDAYKGIVDQDYLDSMTLGKCEEIAFKWPDNLIVAKDGNQVVGFVGYGPKKVPAGVKRASEFWHEKRPRKRLPWVFVCSVSYKSGRQN